MTTYSICFQLHPISGGCLLHLQPDDAPCLYNISMDLREIRREGVDWMHLAQDRDQSQALVNKVMDLWFYKGQGIS